MEWVRGPSSEYPDHLSRPVVYNSAINNHELGTWLRARVYRLGSTSAGNPICTSMGSHHSCQIKTFHGGCFKASHILPTNRSPITLWVNLMNSERTWICHGDLRQRGGRKCLHLPCGRHVSNISAANVSLIFTLNTRRNEGYTFRVQIYEKSMSFTLRHITAV